VRFDVRLALISDIHGNALALKAVLEDIDARGVDQIACLGDVASMGPRPREVLSLLRDHADILIKGNHDDYLLDPALIESYTDDPGLRATVDWCRDQLDEDELAQLRAFEPTHSIEVPSDARPHRLLMFHGSPRSHTENLLDITPADLVERALAGHDATLFAGGHTHLPLLRQLESARLINPGSVGLPIAAFASGKMPRVLAHADYAILEFRGSDADLTNIRLELDPAELRAAADRPGFPFREPLMTSYAVL